MQIRYDSRAMPHASGPALPLRLLLFSLAPFAALATPVERSDPLPSPPIVQEGGLSQWIAQGALRKYATEGTIEADLAEGGFIGRDQLGWDAGKIRAVEIGWYAEEEPGYLTLRWTCEEGARSYASSVSTVYLADRTWQTLLFDVARERLWRGTIKSVRFEVHSDRRPARMGLAYVRALPEVNLVLNADRSQHRPKAAGNPEGVFGGWQRQQDGSWRVPVPRLRPRATYLLDRSGVRHGGPLTLQILDYLYRPLQAIVLSAQQPDVEFTVQPLAVTAELKVTPDEAGIATPRITLIKSAPLLDTPRPWWQAAWIWSRQDFESGPVGPVWFRRVFTLPAPAARAELVMTADDASALWLNGEALAGNKKWSEPVYHDLTGRLTAGTNEIVVRVDNAGAWGGLLLEMYVEMKNGHPYRLQTDGQWQCLEPTEVKPPVSSEISHPAVVLGQPPIEPWGLSIGYRPLGPERGPAPPVGSAQAARARGSSLSDVRVDGVGQRARIVINGRAYPPFTYYLPDSFTRAPAGKENLVRDLAAENLHIFEIADYFSNLWTGPDRYDFSQLARALQVVLAADPRAYVLLSYDVRAPEWWLKAHPDEAMRYYGSEPRNPVHDFQSMSSKLWRQDVVRGLEKFVAHIRSQSYAAHIIGLGVHAGQTSEWIWDFGYGHNALLYSDFSPTGVRAWRDWLRKEYQGDVAALQREWKDPSAVFEKIAPPTPEERNVSDLSCFLDPVKRRSLMDYWRFRQATVADAILSFCGAVKKFSGRKWITGTYFGYLNAFSHIYNALQEAGHLSLDRVLQSPDVDYLVGPGFYHWRKLGLAHGTMQPCESVSANGKLLLGELDQRTFTESLEVQWPNGRVDTVEQTLSMLDRDFGMFAVRGQGFHWMEMMGKWYREPVIQAAMGRELAAWRKLPAAPGGLTPEEVCVVSDLRSPLYVKLNSNDGIHAWLIAELLRRISEAGFTWGQVLLGDLLSPGKIGPHKLYIMTNVLVLSPDERRQIQDRLARERASVLWLYAPGAFTPGRPADSANVAATIGFPVRMLTGKRSLSMRVELAWGGMTATCRADTGPWFLPEPGTGDIEVIARGEAGEPLMARRKEKDRSVWFSAVPNLPPALLRRIAQDAGVWIYERGEDPLHVGNDLIFLHAKTGGEKQILLPFPATLRPLVGPLERPVKSGESWAARSGLTYGFVTERAGLGQRVRAPSAAP